MVTKLEQMCKRNMVNIVNQESRNSIWGDSVTTKYFIDYCENVTRPIRCMFKYALLVHVIDYLVYENSDIGHY